MMPTTTTTTTTTTSDATGNVTTVTTTVTGPSAASATPAQKRCYPIGTPGEAWGEAEKAQWSSECSAKRKYASEVLAKLEPLKADFDVVQYGALSVDISRYPLFAVKTRDWDAAKPSVLVTGGVHGYETSGVQGAILFISTRMKEYGEKFNVVVAPCVSPWGYEMIQRWNNNAEDPNRGFYPNSPGATPGNRAGFTRSSCDECAAIIDLVASVGGRDSFVAHFDCHETTDTDVTEFQPAKAARDGDEWAEGTVPDGFYLVGNTALPQKEFHTAVIDSVRKVTHIAPKEADGLLIGMELAQEGVVNAPTADLFLCSSVTNATYATTTEVYPDSPRAEVTDEQCNRAQVAAIVGGLDYILKMK